MADALNRTETDAVTRVMSEFVEYLDIPMRITLEIGRRSMQVRDILQLKQSSIVDIPKAAGENVDVYINGKLVAFGEILEMENKAGIRLTDFYVQT